MIVHDLNVHGVTIPPAETDSPLVIDPDAVLSFALTLERFQPVGRRHSKVNQFHCVTNHFDLSSGNPLNVTRQFAGKLPACQLLCFLTSKAQDH
jgi:hypothetical protein